MNSTPNDMYSDYVKRIQFEFFLLQQIPVVSQRIFKALNSKSTGINPIIGDPDRDQVINDVANIRRRFDELKNQGYPVAREQSIVEFIETSLVEAFISDSKTIKK